ncbi:MAG: formyltransferase family protein [Acidimicrobiales bacterium]
MTTDVAEAAGVGADLGVVVAFGQILRAELLRQLPMVNVHFSLLPRWRGAAPVERAILAGDARTGVAVMGVAEGLDEGPVYAEVAVDIDPAETADELRARLVAAGSSLLVDTLRSGLDAPVPQEGEVTYAAKITPADLELDWTLPATDLDRRVRVGGAWTTWYLASGAGVKAPMWPTSRSTARPAPSPAPPCAPVPVPWHSSRCSPQAERLDAEGVAAERDPGRTSSSAQRRTACGARPAQDVRPSLAVGALDRIDEGAYANLVLPPMLDRSGLDQRDRHFVTELVYGATRRRRALDHLVDAHLRR